MKMKLFNATCAFVLLGVLSGSLFAQTEPGALTATPAITANDPDKDRLHPQDSFGIQDRSVTWIPMAAFHPRNGASTWTYQFTGYVSRASGSDLLWAPLTIPNGALVDVVRLWIYDQSANDIGMFLTEFGGNTDFTNDIGGFVSSTGTGETSIAFFPAYTVNYSDNLYVIYVSMPIDSDVRAKGARILWYRQISAAPATATFGDVPTTHPFFRFIEALADSGITGGCGGGNYCPDNPLTRGQMAVFLATALGLHHPF